MNPTPYQIEKWQQAHFRPINQFYKREKHKGSASGDEQVFYIHQQDEVIAAVRLVPHEGYFWLRSLYVKEALRGQSLGRQLLTVVHQLIDLPIYCFPYTHLENFYGQCNYQLLSSEQLPANLQQLFKRYQGKGSHIICMGHNVALTQPQ